MRRPRSENGTIELVRTTTLAAYSDGVERYVTAFEFTGEGEEVGSIIPLPDVPTKVERGGDWTLQRLALEVAPAWPCYRADSRCSRFPAMQRSFSRSRSMLSISPCCAGRGRGRGMGDRERVLSQP